MSNLMDRAQGLDMTNIEPLLDEVAALDPDLEHELREAITEAGEALANIAQAGLFEAESSIDSASHWHQKAAALQAELDEITETQA